MFITSICYGRTVSDHNDIPNALAAMHISDKSGNEGSHDVTNSPRNLESSFLYQGTSRVMVGHSELKCCDDVPNALAALHISDNYQKSGNEGCPDTPASSHVTTHIGSMALPSISGTLPLEVVLVFPAIAKIVVIIV